MHTVKPLKSVIKITSWAGTQNTKITIYTIKEPAPTEYSNNLKLLSKCDKKFDVEQHAKFCVLIDVEQHAKLYTELVQSIGGEAFKYNCIITLVRGRPSCLSL